MAPRTFRTSPSRARRTAIRPEPSSSTRSCGRTRTPSTCTRPAGCSRPIRHGRRRTACGRRGFCNASCPGERFAERRAAVRAHPSRARASARPALTSAPGAPVSPPLRECRQPFVCSLLAARLRHSGGPIGPVPVVTRALAGNGGRSARLELNEPWQRASADALLLPELRAALGAVSPMQPGSWEEVVSNNHLAQAVHARPYAVLQVRAHGDLRVCVSAATARACDTLRAPRLCAPARAPPRAMHAPGHAGARSTRAPCHPRRPAHARHAARHHARH